MNYMTIPGLRNQRYPIIADQFYQILTPVETPVKHFISEHAIISAVCEAFQIQIDTLLKKSNRRISVQPRQVCMYIMKHKTELPLNKIGKLLNKDHATVINGIRVCQNEIDTNSIMGNIATKLMQQL